MSVLVCIVCMTHAVLQVMCSCDYDTDKVNFGGLEYWVFACAQQSFAAWSQLGIMFTFENFVSVD